MIDGWLVADQAAPRKQRHTAWRVWQRLVAEHGAVVSEVTVSRYVSRRLVAAIVDRVAFNADILQTGTQSYRLRTSTTTSRRKRAS